MKKTISQSVETAQARAKRWHEMQVDGLNARDIAEKEGGGVTRNAVLGAIFRYRKINNLQGPRPLENRPQNFHPVKGMPRAKKPEVKAEPFRPVFFSDSYEKQVLHDCCRFIIGDPKDKENVKFCAHTRMRPSMYCEGHTALCSIGAGAEYKSLPPEWVSG